MKTYSKFLAEKAVVTKASGFEPYPTAKHLFDFQSACVQWAVRKGKACLFAGTGLGKTAMQLEYARQVFEHTGAPVLIVTPLAVAHQTQKEAARFGLEAVVSHDGIIEGPVTITNYQSLHKFDVGNIGGVVADESGILKSFSGAIRNQLIETFKDTPYKLCCTATPAPNDIEEIGNHAEFIGVMSRLEMLAMFFNHDGGDTSKWRLKRHAENDFWIWLSSWALVFQNPSDIGFDGSRFILPPLHYHEHNLRSVVQMDGMLFAAAPDLSQKREIRRKTIAARVEKAAEIANGTKGQVLIWCDYNDESTALTAAVSGAVEITGSMSDEEKQTALVEWLEKRSRVIVSKPSITGFGVNAQQCSTMIFVGLSDSWEQFYQAVRRCWRFGQKKPVNVHIVVDNMESTLENIKRKGDAAEKMLKEMVKHMESEMMEGLGRPVERTHSEYQTAHHSGKTWELYVGDCVDQMRHVPDDSIGMSVYSPPFASLYTYSDSERDMGNCRDDSHFLKHYAYLLRELYRAFIPGRVMAVHCMDMPMLKSKHGEIGVIDLPGLIIRQAQRAGFIFDGRITIWKDPVVAMQRTKSIRLLHKQIKKDSTVSGPAAPDYLLKFKKPGDNPKRVTHDNDSFPVTLWQRYASPVWMDIDQGNTLQYRHARGDKDERHLCPLQLDVIERAVFLWSKEGDVILSPFAGIGSEGWVALKMKRRFIGIELKPSYAEIAVQNLKDGEATADQDLFSAVAE